jgi:GT2 family glycosyltransferase
VTQTSSPAAAGDTEWIDGHVLSSIREVGVDALPIPRVEMELSDGVDDLAAIPAWGHAPRVMALVRLHTHPMGMVVLDGRLGPSRSLHAAGIWAALQCKINAHLAADGHQSAACLADLVLPSVAAPPQCLLHRAAVVAQGPFLTVVVATRDRPDSLAACLTSLLKTDYPRFEIIVVDNDPTSDDTAVMLREQFGSVRYVQENRRGLASAHNRGLALARGEVIAFVDDDVLVDQSWMPAIAEGFAQTDGVGCVTGLILPEELETPAQLLLEHRGGYGKGFDQLIVDADENRPPDPLFPFAAGRLGSGANMAFDTEKLRSAGGFDAALGVGTCARGGDDLIGIFRMIIAGHRVVYQPDAIVWHRHYREFADLRNMAYGCGVGMGAFLASAITHEPRLLPQLLRCFSFYMMHRNAPPATSQQSNSQAWPAELLRLERRGLLLGPKAYALSRWKAWRGDRTDT